MENNSEGIYLTNDPYDGICKNIFLKKKDFFQEKKEENSKYLIKKSNEKVYSELKNYNLEEFIVYQGLDNSENKKIKKSINEEPKRIDDYSRNIHLEEVIRRNNEYNSPKLNNYQREEELEEIIRRNNGEIHIYTGLEQNNYIQRFEELLRDIRLNSNSKDANYFRRSARTILDNEASHEELNALTNALINFQKSSVIQGFETEYLPEFLKQDVNLGKRELSKYKLKLDVQMDNSHYGERFKEKFFDTPFNFCLTYEGKLIASVGFNPEKGRIFIEQIQGIKGKHKELSPFKWERALVNYVVKWAQEHGIQEVSVVSAENNKWAKKHGHLNLEQGKMLYDVTAKRSGFKKGEDGNYHKFFGNTQASEKVEEELSVEAA